MRSRKREDGVINRVGRGNNKLPDDEARGNERGLARTGTFTAKYHAVLLAGRSRIELLGCDQQCVRPSKRDVVRWSYPRGERRTGCDLTGARAVHEHGLRSNDYPGVSWRRVRGNRHRPRNWNDNTERQASVVASLEAGGTADEDRGIDRICGREEDGAAGEAACGQRLPTTTTIDAAKENRAGGAVTRAGEGTGGIHGVVAWIVGRGRERSEVGLLCRGVLPRRKCSVCCVLRRLDGRRG